MACQTLEQVSFSRVNIKVAQLDLRLRPGQGAHAVKGGGILVCVNKIQKFFPGRCCHSPERNAGSGSRFESDPATKRK
ncbi:hypothetical protein Amal_03706 [Acetobacter malorum]|uniref:Uncharacterized protein n=1 Tax=Acetobacter malorum TaxID=178901 RepID=A0A177G446_9PROT|nr:hypothetical protein Amal_03706 [Acetobacter malorum]